MNTAKYALLVFKALFEITRYDVTVSSLGVGRILRQLRKQSVFLKPCTEELQKKVCDAVLLASCFYWKPVLCLQRSVCTTVLLRKYGIGAKVVIGYRPAPFFSHSWVEVNGHVAYGSAAYQQRLQILATA